MLHSLRLPAPDPGLAQLLSADAPTRPRALAVLRGRLSGFAWERRYDLAAWHAPLTA